MAHTGEVRALWITTLVAGITGCAADEADSGDGPLTYSLSAFWVAPMGAPVVTKPVVYIDGVQVESVTYEYPTTASAKQAVHVIELRHGDQVVFSQSAPGADHYCLAYVGSAITAAQSWCAYGNGDLRYAGDQAHGTSGDVCVGDGFCRPRCVPPAAYCAPNERCTSIYGSLDPIATHLGCAPAGARLAGDTCALVVDAAGMHDDCAAGLLCVEGTCRQTCLPGSMELPAGCTACSFVAGHAPEMGICD
jgi:hypothetical protein